MKKFINVLVVLILFSIFVPVRTGAQAERIKSIDVDVILEEDGTAKVVQVWDISTHKGTEFFIPITELKDMKLENFKVTDEEGRDFEFVENWNVKGSLEDKAFKCGINSIPNGFELCWGKGSYGDHRYTVSWDYKNAVQAYSDYDGFNIRFINDKMTPAPENISIRISKPGSNLSAENTKIWAFGYVGELVFKDDGKVQGKSFRTLNKNEYMNIMMRFEKGMFNPQVKHNDSFERLKTRAMEGATSNEKKSVFTNPIVAFTASFGFFFLTIIIVLCLNRLQGPVTGFYNGKRTNFIPKIKPRKGEFKKVDYNRELPCDNELIKMYYIQRLFIRTREFGNLISAYILKWIKNNNIIPEERLDLNSSNVNKDDKLILHINNEPEFESITERDIWGILVKAAGKNGILEEKEFKKFAKKEFGELSSWINFALVDGAISLLESGGLGIINNDGKLQETQITESGREEIENYFGFEKFLKDFTIIQERQIKEVELWDDYLIIATLMGQGKEVMKQMNELIPNYIFGQGTLGADGSNYYTNLAIISTVNSLGNSGMKGYNSGSLSASMGDGGSSFSGGGGGFSGGGSGGGSR